MTTDLDMTGVDFLNEKDQIAKFLDRDSHPGTRGKQEILMTMQMGKKCNEIEEIAQQLHAWPWEVLH
jgi:hypothetical protein